MRRKPLSSDLFMASMRAGLVGMVIELGKALHQALVLEMMNSFELVSLKLELHFDHVVKDK